MLVGTVEKKNQKNPHHIKDLKKYLEQCGVSFSAQKITQNGVLYFLNKKKNPIY